MAEMKNIRLSKSCIGEKEKNAVMRVLDSEFLGMGSEVEKFEKELTNYLGRQAICVTNGTAALQLSLQAAGIGTGDEVLVQSLTYLASFQAIKAAGATPIPCDVNLENITINLNDAKNKLSKRTAAIMPVHYAGEPGDLDEIYNFANKYKIRVIEDAAHAFGSTYKGKKIGSFGDIACFSFDGIKNITSGEGGCISSSDNHLISKVKDLRLLGVLKDSEKRYSNQRTWVPEVEDQGWRYHMSDVMAAIGRVQLGRLDEFSQKRKELALYYDALLAQSNNINYLNHNYENINPHIYPVILNEKFTREIIRENLKSMGIQTGVHYYPNHLLNYFKEGNHFLENTERIFLNIMTLPLHPDLTFNDIDFICSNLINLLS